MKTCHECKKQFEPNHWNQRFCGSKKSKNGCAYLRRLAFERETQKKLRKLNPDKYKKADRLRRPKKGPFSINCQLCGNKFVSNIPWTKYCGNRNIKDTCAYKNKVATIKNWVSKNMPRILKLNKNWALKNKKKFKMQSKKARKKWSQTEHGKKVINQNSKKYKHQRRTGGILDLNHVKQIFDKNYGNLCACCLTNQNISIDHKIPVSLGGSNEIKNLQPLCIQCNVKKYQKIIIYPELKNRMLTMLKL